ncbi:probable magnesium transporter NIPA1 isoform X2 [Malania oleifera]|uniref:probable magnesium transporter NIPA1 isoform X2 n=1 Tax=Malania oleifera TaxID=397392 RepID=UPI0025AE5CAB|nr:probable magnesium transporter NIPA1 isoform X2 [Malania oleifera]
MAASLVTPGESVLSSSTDNLKGFVLAIASSAFIGSSFIIKKKGLQRAGALGPRAIRCTVLYAVPAGEIILTGIILGRKRIMLTQKTTPQSLCPQLVGNHLQTREVEVWRSWLVSERPLQCLSSGGYGYLLEPLWWVGMVTMVVGEIANFIAYIYAPAVLVTPLGALSIIVSAVLAHFLLKEKLRKMGILGCVLCIVGSTLIVLHAPSERSLSSVEEIWELAIQPAFLLYTASAIAVVLVLVLYCEPRYGQTNIMVYIGICSIIGSLTVMSIKAIGIAIKLTLEGSSQVAHFQTWVFLMVAITCIITQLNYLNKALDTFDTAVVSPIYFAMFTSFTILASAIMFKISMHHILLKYLGLSLSMVKYGSGKMMKSCALIFLRSFDMTISNERCLGISILQSTEGSAE